MPVSDQFKIPVTNLPEPQQENPVIFEKSDELSSGSTADQTLGQIVAKDAGKAEIFNRYGLDFCCGGKKTLKEACIEKGLDTAKIEQELQQVNRSFFIHDLPYNDWKPGFLADFIVNTHHSYVKRTLPEIKNLALKVMTAHGKSHPELLMIMQLVEDIYTEMFSHMIKEEEILFPFIKQLDAAVEFQSMKSPLLIRSKALSV